MFVQSLTCFAGPSRGNLSTSMLSVLLLGAEASLDGNTICTEGTDCGDEMTAYNKTGVVVFGIGLGLAAVWCTAHIVNKYCCQRATEVEPSIERTIPWLEFECFDEVDGVDEMNEADEADEVEMTGTELKAAMEII